MIIQLDVDGVLADFRSAWRALGKRMYNVDVPLTETSWDQLYGPPLGPERTDAMWNHIKQSLDFWGKVEPLISKDEARRLALLTKTHAIYFVTARPGKTAWQQTSWWLTRTLAHPMPGYERDAWIAPEIRLIISDRKAEMANALRADYVIDDKPGNVLATYYLSPPERKVYIRDHPFNQFDSEVAGKRIRRVKTLGEFLDDVERGR